MVVRAHRPFDGLYAGISPGVIPALISTPVDGVELAKLATLLHPTGTDGGTIDGTKICRSEDTDLISH
jgi:hypothetical protein